MITLLPDHGSAIATETTPLATVPGNEWVGYAGNEWVGYTAGNEWVGRVV